MECHVFLIIDAVVLACIALCIYVLCWMIVSLFFFFLIYSHKREVDFTFSINYIMSIIYIFKMAIKLKFNNNSSKI